MAANKEIRKAIGLRLREVRLEQKQTQKQVSESLGLSRQMINRYESGRDAPTGERLLKVLRYVGNRIELPQYAYTLTAESLEVPSGTRRLAPEQLNLKLDKVSELRNSYVRIVPKKNSIEIFISAVAVGTGKR